MNLSIEPKEVFKWFYEINQIPRESHHEEKISEFLVNFAKERNLEVIQDKALNVIIKKKASEGYENSKTLIIQGHMDMVCVKDENSNHDFGKDPIEMYVEDGWLRAKGTTLGADDGIAVAFALAILDDSSLKHPPLEVLITTAEETTMGGAGAIEKGLLKGDMLLNIDSEEEGIFLVSCAGGTSVEVNFEIERDEFDARPIKISIKGLSGGHSGSEIIKEKANANILLGRVLDKLREKFDLRIIHIKGGSKHNAIADGASADILLKDEKYAREVIEKLEKELQEEFFKTDSNLRIEVTQSEIEESYTKELTNKIIDYLLLTPNGVCAMSKDIDNLVETSLNVAIIEEDEEVLKILTSIRSSRKSHIELISKKIQVLAKALGGEFKKGLGYPAWQFEKDSALRDIALKTFKEVMGTDAKYEAIHAGIECGILKEVLPNCDMLSYGPDILGAHSPEERLSIKSTENMWKFTKKLLENLK